MAYGVRMRNLAVSVKKNHNIKNYFDTLWCFLVRVLLIMSPISSRKYTNLRNFYDNLWKKHFAWRGSIKIYTLVLQTKQFSTIIKQVILHFYRPMLVHIMAQPRLFKGDGPIGLILVPTRELAMQPWCKLVSGMYMYWRSFPIAGVAWGMLTRHGGAHLADGQKL